VFTGVSIGLSLSFSTWVTFSRMRKLEELKDGNRVPRLVRVSE
jgi:hypothetical protein